MADKIIVIANPASGRGGRLEKALSALRARGADHELLLTKGPGDAEPLARQAAASGHEMVLVAGGDGTFNEAINGLAGTSTPMGIIPVGTTNVLAYELGIPFDIEQAVERALSGKPRRVNLGRIEQGGRQRYFCLMAGVGFDADVVHGIDLKFKKRTGKLAYITRAVSALSSWRPEPFSVSVDGQAYECYSCIVCKASRYGGSFTLAREASLTEPLLHLRMIQSPSRLAIAGFALRMVAGAFSEKCVSGREVRISGNANIQLDGDPHGNAPAAITVAEGALSLIW